MLLKKLDNSENISLRLFIILRQLQEVPSRSLIIMKSKTSTIFRKEKIELETTSRQCRRRSEKTTAILPRTMQISF